MAKSFIRKTFRSLMSTISPPVDDTSTDNSSMICEIFNLPIEILQTITVYLNTRDVISLSQTCRTFHTLINDDNFWIHRICCQFPQPIAQLYTYDLFQKPEIIQTNDETRPSGLNNTRADRELDFAAINSATHYHDEAIEQRRAKMYISKEDFLTTVQYFRFRKPNKHSHIPVMKLMYFYLIDRKRASAADMSVVHLNNNNYLVKSNNINSLTGHTIVLNQVCWLEISGEFEHVIMPGNYRVLWRMKVHQNDVYIRGQTEFIVAPTHGKMLVYLVSGDDFRSYKNEYGNQWFLADMGRISIYEPSKVFVGIRNWQDSSWKSGITWDCIELIPAP